MTNIMLDDGYRYGVGVFETIGVENKQTIFLDEHLTRLEQGLKTLGVENRNFRRSQAAARLRELAAAATWRRASVKIIVSASNITFGLRENPYQEEMYRRGAALKLSDVFRNESSPLTYCKSLNYADNVLEKAKATAEGYDEVIFFNSGNILAEGSVSNIFCVKDGTIYTPAVSCGLLDGVMRRFVLENAKVREAAIIKSQLYAYDEFFLTNSLMGIMPVRSIGAYHTKTMATGEALHSHYLAFLAGLEQSVRQNKKNSAACSI